MVGKKWKRLEPIEHRFWRQVKKTDGCWLWTSPPGRAGYGLMAVPGEYRKVYAHRFSWEFHNGPIPDGKNVLHKCDVRACVNPDHLYLGDQSDNLRDAWARSGRVPAGFCLLRGEANNQSKLTEDKVRHIRILANEGIRHRAIAEETAINQTTVSRVVRRETWAHVK